MRQTTIGHAPSVFRASREFPKGPVRDPGAQPATGRQRAQPAAGTRPELTRSGPAGET